MSVRSNQTDLNGQITYNLCTHLTEIWLHIRGVVSQGHIGLYTLYAYLFPGLLVYNEFWGSVFSYALIPICFAALESTV